MSRDLNLHVGALKRRAGRFKTLLKQLLLTLHSLQTPSGERVERSGGKDGCASPASVPLFWEPVSSGCSSCDCPPHEHASPSRIHGSWCMFIGSSSKAGIVLVALQLSCFHPSASAVLPFQMIFVLWFWFSAPCNFFPGCLFPC